MKKSDLFAALNTAHKSAAAFIKDRPLQHKISYYICFDSNPFEPFEIFMTNGQYRDSDISIRKYIDKTSWHKYIVTIPTDWLYGEDFDWI